MNPDLEIARAAKLRPIQEIADKLGIHPDEMHYVQGDTDQVFYGEGTGGSRSATMGGSAFDRARRPPTAATPR